MQLLDTTPAALTRLTRELGWLEPAQSITELAVAGAGNMNVVLRAQLAPSGSLILKQSLPYVAKYPDIPAPVARIEAEVAFYQTIATSPVAARMPRLLGFAPDLHLCAFEDLGSGEDFSFLYQRDEARSIPSPALLTWLSQLHSIAVSDAAIGDNMAMRQLNHEHIFDLPFRADSGLSFSPALEQFRDQLLHAELRATAQALGEIYLGRASQPCTNCLLHGDFYPGSWVQGQDGEVMIIDPEFGFVGPAEFDVGVYLAHLLMCGLDTDALTASLSDYTEPAGFNHTLMWQFAGVEVMRRILGVAQLPWRADDDTKMMWLQQAGDWMIVQR